MIYVTQGHELGIGLEVFLKSFITLSNNDAVKFTLIVSENTLMTNLQNLKLKFTIKDDFLFIAKRKLKLIIITESHLPQSTLALELALRELSNKSGVLITLPTSKDQLIYQQQSFSGYTEYLRAAFKSPLLPMFFYSENLKVLLLTDHLKLSQVPNAITEDLVISKINFSLKFFKFNHVYISGINPHAGENGILGTEENVITKSIDKLKVIHPCVNFYGPISGDILHYKISSTENQLLVYCYHDQGLILFKSRQSLMGINITLGLPFLRMSVDHGTGFDLYGKNKANYLGCFYVLKKALDFYE